MFSIAKIFFYYTECKKYNNKKIPAKIFEPATSRSPSFYSTAAPATLHAARHDTTRLRRRPTSSIIFFGERRAH